MRPGFNSTYLFGIVAAAIIPLILNQDFVRSLNSQSESAVETDHSVQFEDAHRGPLLSGPDSTNSFKAVDDDALAPTFNQNHTNRFVGTNACVLCHKDGHPFPTHSVAGKEYSIWANKDPHSCAYAVLFNEQSLLIAKNLKLQIPPHKNELCLNCHTTNVAKHQLAFESQLSSADGVGCESCHGGAENWLVQHKLPSFKFMSSSQKEWLGFVNTDNMATRARKCAECHIGSEGRDVNHDLIAAGHPRLYFEMAAYQSIMPRHWSRSKELVQNLPTYEARLWLVGQLVSAAASLDLLHQRVNEPDSPWPEFAEYGCFSCHHNLEAKQWKTDKNYFANGVGNLNWGSWHFSSLDVLLSDSNFLLATGLTEEIQQLRDLMQERLPDQAAIDKLSKPLSNRLNQLADHLSLTPLDEPGTLELSNQLFLHDDQVDTLNWDALTQRYLAAVAFRQALMDSRWVTGTLSGLAFENSKQKLSEIRDSLTFGEDYNSPRKLESSEREEIYRSFSAVFEQLKN